ncbi:hypothetical protein EYR41_000343 [Orbilia oligospora]|uniref:Derlin n=1 Tax=Orbilia oligospora TaxID=2813651 RepID=A0A8H2E887_ORBOL|nr:hypothetical protein EYR41_000343 [Orbilia oligospora]
MANVGDAVANLLNATPPVTRFYAGVTLILSLSVHVFGLLSPYKVLWHPMFIMSHMPPQLWRIFSSFFLTSKDLGILFDTYTIYKYGLDLETIHFNTSGDFLWYLLFNGTVILLLNSFLLGGMVFAQVMGIAFAYSWGQRNRGRNISFFFITIKAQWLPYAIAGITAIQSPGSAFILTSGIISAHAYEFLTVLWPRFGGGSNLLPTPSFLKWSFEGGPGTRTGGVGGVRAYGTGFDARARDAGPAPARAQGMFGGDGGSATGSNPRQAAGASWRNRGAGHRLGTD